MEEMGRYLSTILKKIRSIDPTEFENLTFDLLQELGLENVVWRTPGADGGRDIECEFPTRDLSGALLNQKWFVECKRYSSSVDWPTVWNKAAYAENNNADFLLLVTTSDLSPTCETEISKWNSGKKRPIIRAWRSYQLEGILSRHPAIQLKYGLSLSASAASQSFVDLANDAMKAAQAAYAASEVGADVNSPLQTSAALSELLSVRMQDFKVRGKIAAMQIDPKVDLYSFLDWPSNNPHTKMDRFAFRAFVSTLHTGVRCRRILAEILDETSITITIEDDRLMMTPALVAALRRIVLWSNFELVKLDNRKAILKVR